MPDQRKHYRVKVYRGSVEPLFTVDLWALDAAEAVESAMRISNKHREFITIYVELLPK